MFDSTMDASAPPTSSGATGDGVGARAVSVPDIDLPAVDALIMGMAEVRASVARLQSLEATMMAAAVEVVSARNTLSTSSADHEMAWREMCADVATALHISDRTVQSRLNEASVLVESFPATHAAMSRGEIDRSHARVIVDAGTALPTPEARAQYEDQVLVRAKELTPGRLRPVCRTAATRIDPTTITERHRTARASRGVRVVGLEDGMARLQLDAAATLVHAVFDRATQLARDVQQSAGEAGQGAGDTGGHRDSANAGVGGSTDERTLDQTRADVLTDLLLTAAPTGQGRAAELEKIDAHVQVTVPASVLHPERGSAGAPGTPDTHVFSREHAELAGHGPIDDETARLLAGAARGWDRIFTDTATGNPLHVDRYRPSEHLRRLLRVRDEHCRFPGCRQPAWRCDLDHTVDAAYGGPTENLNLAHLCRGHHTLKHHSRWRVRQLADGVLEWTSPTGRIHDDVPAPRVRFIEPDPPPF